jgi:hypothetical protein
MGRKAQTGTKEETKIKDEEMEDAFNVTDIDNELRGVADTDIIKVAVNAVDGRGITVD